VELGFLRFQLGGEGGAIRLEPIVLLGQALDGAQAAGPQDMGKVMAWLKPRLAGKADLSAISARVGALLRERAAR
jgi:hypothetical protein